MDRWIYSFLVGILFLPALGWLPSWKILPLFSVALLYPARAVPLVIPSSHPLTYHQHHQPRILISNSLFSFVFFSSPFFIPRFFENQPPCTLASLFFTNGLLSIPPPTHTSLFSKAGTLYPYPYLTSSPSSHLSTRPLHWSRIFPN